MNRRGFLRAVGAAGMWLALHPPAAAERQSTAGLIRAAIRSRRVLRFRYQGLMREAEPHALGTVASGRVALLAWQAAGESRSEPPPGWRTFLVEEISELNLLRKKFRVRPSYQRDRVALKTIEAEVSRE